MLQPITGPSSGEISTKYATECNVETNEASLLHTRVQQTFNTNGVTQRFLAKCWKVLGSNSDESDIFRTRPNRPWGPPSLLQNGYRVIPGGNAAGRRVNHSPPTSAEVKERVGQYLYSYSGFSWHVPKRTLPFTSSSCIRDKYEKHNKLKLS